MKSEHHFSRRGDYMVPSEKKKNVPIIVPGSKSKSLARHVARLCKGEFLDVERKKFSDRDQYVRLLILGKNASLARRTIYIVQTLYPGQDSALVELLLLIDAAKRTGASKIIPIIPYMAYSRQDKKFLEGESIAANAILKSLGCLSIITFDSHFNRGRCLFEREGVWIRNISAFPLIVEAARELSKGAGLVFVAPDQSVQKSLKSLLRYEDCVIVFEKTRNRHTGRIESVPQKLPVGHGWKGLPCVLIDDMITSGTTMALAAKLLRDAGHHGKMIAACTHGIFTNDCEKKLKTAGIGKIISTDTVRTRHSTASIAPLICDEINKTIK